MVDINAMRCDVAGRDVATREDNYYIGSCNQEQVIMELLFVDFFVTLESTYCAR